MYHFDIHVQALPDVCHPGPPLTFDGVVWPTLSFPNAARPHGLATFDEALTALERLPRMFVEPDGSFVWVTVENDQRWQVDGNLFDRGDELAYVQLSGHCPQAAFDQLLGCCGWPATRLIFQLSRAGVFVEESVFRSLAERPPK